MNAFALDPTRLAHLAEALGAVVTEEVKTGGQRLFRKGHRLTEEDLVALATLPAAVHAVRLDPDDVHEDEAGTRLAAAVVAAGTAATSGHGGPRQYRARHRGSIGACRPEARRNRRLQSNAVLSPDANCRDAA